MKPIFIGGTGRSGTTILKRILTHHSKIVGLRDELRVIVDPDGALTLISALTENWSPYNADAAIHAFRHIMLNSARSNSAIGVKLEKIERKLFRIAGVSPRSYLGGGFAYQFDSGFYYRRLDELIDQLCFAKTPGSWIGSHALQIPSVIYETTPLSRHEVNRIIINFFEDLYQQLATNGETHWIDDTPTNLLHAHQLLSLFSDAKLLHIYRDPRDVTASFARFHWGGKDFSTIARRLASIYDRWFEIRDQLATEQFMEISLEKLASDPHRYLQRICSFLQIDFENSLLELALNNVNQGRWRQDIPRPKWKRVETTLHKFIVAYGYHLQN